MTQAPARKIVVLGMMTRMPVAGVVWQTMHYVLGLERLGYEVYYVESHGLNPSMLMEHEHDDGSGNAAAFIAGVARRFGLSDRWAFHAPYEDGRCYGLSGRELERLYGSAELLINLHGGTVALPEHSATDRLVYVETDPVAVQVELHEGIQETIDYLEPHRAFFTFAENYGAPDCGLPVSERFPFLSTRQPVVLDWWDSEAPPPGRRFTTVGNWRQSWRSVRLAGEVFEWSKHHEFLRFLDLPRRTTEGFELALAGPSFTPDDRRLLEESGWSVRDALEFSTDLDAYREYIAASRGEFTVAKDQNVRLRTGWFSDRSATYLAAGRPVVTQDTGFSNVLPTGEGLFAFSTSEEVLAALEAISVDYASHSRAAVELAREYFDADVVLSRLLSDLGLPARRPSARGSEQGSFASARASSAAAETWARGRAAG